MKVILFIATLILSLGMSGCAESSDVSSEIGNYDAVYREVYATLKNATLPDTFIVTRTLHFSDSITMDTFQLKIEPGLIAKSKALLQIKTKDNRILYCQTFDARFFADYLFAPDTTIPLNRDEEQKYLMRKLKRVTRPEIEQRVKEECGKVFSDLVVNRDDLRELEQQEIVDTAMYNHVIADANTKAVFLPCLTSDMCGNWLAYSHREEKAIIFLRFQ